MKCICFFSTYVNVMDFIILNNAIIISFVGSNSGITLISGSLKQEIMLVLSIAKESEYLLMVCVATH